MTGKLILVATMLSITAGSAFALTAADIARANASADRAKAAGVITLVKRDQIKKAARLRQAMRAINAVGAGKEKVVDPAGFRRGR